MGWAEMAGRGNGMTWRVMLELIGGDGTVSTYEIGGGGSNTAECSAATVGLTLADGKRILAALQHNLVRAHPRIRMCHRKDGVFVAISPGPHIAVGLPANRRRSCGGDEPSPKGVPVASSGGWHDPSDLRRSPAIGLTSLVDLLSGAEAARPTGYTCNTGARVP